MEQSRLRIVLRALVVALACTLVLGLALEFLGENLLPEALRDWQPGDAEPEGLQALFLLFMGFVMLALIGAYLAALAGVFFYKRWAAHVMLILSFLMPLFYLVEPTVEPGISSLIGHWDALLTGAVLAICFLTDALEPSVRP